MFQYFPADDNGISTTLVIVVVAGGTVAVIVIGVIIIAVVKSFSAGATVGAADVAVVWQ